jgi:hypothetical protein
MLDFPNAAIRRPTGNEIFHVRDIVRISSGQRLIITEVNTSRPANIYVGVLEGGKGRRLKFGHKHRPVKVGEASGSHPALMALQQRTNETDGFDASYKSLVLKLCEAVENGQTDIAKTFAKVLKSL